MGPWGYFIGGALFSTLGVDILSSDGAKKVYTQCTAAVLRGKDYVMDTAALIKENCVDIYADAVDINEKKYEKDDERELEIAKAIVEASEQTADEQTDNA